MKVYHPIFFIFFLLLLTGCGGQQETKDSELALMKTTNPPPVAIEQNKDKEKELARQIKDDVHSIKDLYDAAIVKGKKDILVVYKVKHLQRFRMKKIEKQVTEMLEKKYPDEQFTVSSDYKIFLEAVKLNEKIKDPKFTQEEAEKQLQKIITLKNEMT